MKLKRNFIRGILLIIATFMTTTDCVDNKKGGGPSRWSKLKNSITSIYNMSPKTYKNWNTSAFARNFNKAVGFAPIVKENQDKKKEMILARLQATIELVKYYGTVWNCPKVKWTFAQGIYFTHVCVKLYGEEKQGECLKKKIQLFSAFMFSYKLEINRFTRFFLKRMNNQVDKYLPGDKTIKFVNTKIACEIKFMQDNKNIFLKTALKLYMGSSTKDKTHNCVTELLPYENDFKDVDSSEGEIQYLIAKAYGYQNNYKLAIEHLRKARKAEVFDAKTREINKKAQGYYEKIYTRLYTFAK